MNRNSFNLISALLLILLFSAGLATTSFSEVSSKVALTPEETAFISGKQLRLGIDSARPPFEFIDTSGAYQGISAGFIEEAARRLGIKVIPQKDIKWKDSLEKTKTGDIDVIPKITPTPERKKFLVFTKPYVNFPTVIVARKDIGKSISSLNDLIGLKVGVVKGLVVEQRLKSDHPRLTLVQSPDVETGLRELSTGSFDVFVEQLGTVAYNIDKIGLTNLKIVSDTPYTNDLAFGVRLDWPLMASALDKALASISKKERDAIIGKWITVEYMAGVDWKVVGPIAAAFLIVIIFVFIWNRRLSRVISDRAAVQQELKEYAHELESRSEYRIRISTLSLTLQKAATFEELAQVFLSQTMPLLGADYGILYFIDKDKDLLVPIGGYGCSEAKIAFSVSQGLVGQCALDMKPITVTDTSTYGIRIKWGMGEIAPKVILIQPIIQREKAIGVFELAAINALTEYSRQLLEEVLPTLAMNIEVLDRNLRTQTLLDETMDQAVKLSTQQDELRAASLQSEEANKALQNRLEELAGARRTMMNIMEDLEISRKEAEERSKQTQQLLEESTRHSEKLKAQQEQLKEQMTELEKFNRLTINREEKMIQLKEEINNLLEQQGKDKKYKIVE